VNGKPINNNIPKWCNAEFNDLLVKARVVSDQAERAKLYQRMQEIEHDEQPELLVAHSIVFESMRSNVKGYKQSPLGTHAFEGVDLQ
jgi:dipeptide transport system substrate-binding protein